MFPKDSKGTKFSPTSCVFPQSELYTINTHVHGQVEEVEEKNVSSKGMVHQAYILFFPHTGVGKHPSYTQKEIELVRFLCLVC